MDREYIKKWLNSLKKYWLDKDIERAAALFKDTKFYQETPFLKPYTEYDEIAKEWENIKRQDIKELDFKILAIENNTVVVNWIFKVDIEEYDGIYEIKFNNNNECIYFKSWEMQK